MRRAIITGITGQDGSYLTELLLEKGYTVYGIVRRASMFNRSRIEHLRVDSSIYGQRLFLEYADLHDATTLRRLIKRIRPDELYHLAGQSHVGLSFEIPESTCDDVARGTLGLLEICRDQEHPIRVYHASSSEVFGKPDTVPQTESTAFRPQSPYGCAKAFATDLCRVYREAYGMFVCSGIAYNHESPRRGENFVTRKITAAAARIKSGKQACLWLGNLSANRDWGYAKEYVEGMWRMLQRDKPDDFILATGEVTSVRGFVCAAFESLGMAVHFEGNGADEVGRNGHSAEPVIRVDPRYFRPTDPDQLVGRPGRALAELGWKAHTTSAALAALMTQADLQQLA
jgi:GDPmannose 4,6-dehydratase